MNKFTYLDDFEIYASDPWTYEYQSMSYMNNGRDYEKALLGSVFGQAVADALGAPFEFGPPNQYQNAFGGKPVLVGNCEMIGGGAFRWRPGEYTDDTQMALIGIDTLLDHCSDMHSMYKGLSSPAMDEYLADLYSRYQKWSRTAADVGTTTRGSLSHTDWRSGARSHHERYGYSDSNGCVMRLGPMLSAFISIFGDVVSLTDILDFAEKQTQLTHWDQNAVDASRLMAWILYDIYSSIESNGFDVGNEAEMLASIVDRLQLEFSNSELVTVFGFRDADVVLNGSSNGKAITCLAQAVWSIHETNTFEDAIAKAINIGGDTDTVGAVTGAIAGALYGVDSIPARWITRMNGEIPGTEYGHMDYDELNYFVHDAILGVDSDDLTRMEKVAEPQRLDSGVELYAANLPGVVASSDDTFHLISLCRTGGLTRRFNNRRNFFIIDTPGANPHLRQTVVEAIDTIDAWLDAGKKVVVHCHAGRSRTGFILKAWYMRRYGVSHVQAHKWLDARWSLYNPDGNYDFTKFLDDFPSVLS